MPGRKLEWIKLRKTTQRQASLQGFYRRIASHEYRALYRWESGFFLSCVILTDMKHFLFFFWRCHANCTIISSNSKIHFVDKEAADFCVFMFFTWMGFYYHLQCIRHRLRYKSVVSPRLINIVLDRSFLFTGPAWPFKIRTISGVCFILCLSLS